MVEIRELMIKNIVADNTGATVTIDSKHFCDHRHHFTGIPITDDWLLKLGFKLDKEGLPTWEHRDYKIQYKKGWMYYRVGTEFMEISKFRCEFVHQLQNLFFVIIGVELYAKENMK